MRRLTALLFTGLLGSFVYIATATGPADNTDNTGFLGKGRYRIQSVASGYFLALRDDKQTLQQWSGSGALNQQWDVADAGGGYFHLRSAETGKVLEVMNTRDGSGVHAKEQKITGRDQQKWRIVDLGNGQSLIVARSGKVLDVADNSRREGTRLQIWGEHRGDNQRFRFDRVAANNR